VGQKVHPYGFRLGVNKTWVSTWCVRREFPALLLQDIKLREYVKKTLSHAGISKVEVERSADRVRISIHTARPGIIIGKKGSEVDRLKEDLQKMIEGKRISLDIKEVRRAELDANLVAQNVALQLEKRISFRRAMKKTVLSSLRFGALGIKIRVSGRLGGAEIARSEWYREGRVPLHTIRADIDYGTARANTTFGVIGVKAWVYRGDILPGAGVSETEDSFGAKDKNLKKTGARRG
jgi:small subunit ribosomal protein S3